jgi:hypothetical protein
MTQSHADEVAARLDLDLNCVCHACLCVVSLAVEGGEPREIADALARMTPDLWADGLEGRALTAATRACELDVPNASEALADLELRGAKSVVAQAIVRRLAEQLSARTRATLRWEAEMN